VLDGEFDIGGSEADLLKSAETKLVGEIAEIARRAFVIASDQNMMTAMRACKKVYGDHVQTAEALSSVGALKATLGDVDNMRRHYSECLEMLHRLDEIDRFSVVLADFVELCVQAGLDQRQLRGLTELLQAMRVKKALQRNNPPAPAKPATRPL
jgi:hypothetical protein